MGTRHEPVLLRETLAALLTGPGLYLDATVGDAGHAEALLDADPGVRLLATDRDPAAIDSARRRLARFGGRVTVAQATFRALPEIVRAQGEPLAGALVDLGLSSRQIDEPGRGMSFGAEGPLDLRMDPSHGVPARERVAAASEQELADVLREHADLVRPRRLAQAMIAAARAGTLETTADLVRLVDRVLGGRPHPRRHARVFQALRMWINEEAEELEAMLAWLPGVVRPGGVVVTIAYHSGDDRRIKHALRGAPPEPPRRGLPALPRSPEGPWETIHRKVVRPTDEEVARNRRARSARMRAFKRSPA